MLELRGMQGDSKRSESRDEFPTRRDLSVKEILTRFKGLLGEMGVQYGSLTINKIGETWPAKISVDGQRNIKLLFNPSMLQYLTVKQVDSLLYHEACHAVALPATVMPCVDGGAPIPLLTDYFDCYAEYLAHVEFLKRYRATEIHEGLSKVHLWLLDNIEMIIRYLRQELDPDPSIRLGEDAFQMREPSSFP